MWVTSCKGKVSFRKGRKTACLINARWLRSQRFRARKIEQRQNDTKVLVAASSKPVFPPSNSSQKTKQWIVCRRKKVFASPDFILHWKLCGNLDENNKEKVRKHVNRENKNLLLLSNGQKMLLHIAFNALQKHKLLRLKNAFRSCLHSIPLDSLHDFKLPPIVSRSYRMPSIMPSVSLQASHVCVRYQRNSHIGKLLQFIVLNTSGANL